MVQKFRKKPVVIEAVQFTGSNFNEINEFTNGQAYWIPINDKPAEYVYIKTLEGDMQGAQNDWIIKGVKGEFYPCKPDIFESTYESAE